MYWCRTCKCSKGLCFLQTHCSKNNAMFESLECCMKSVWLTVQFSLAVDDTLYAMQTETRVHSTKTLSTSTRAMNRQVPVNKLESLKVWKRAVLIFFTWWDHKGNRKWYFERSRRGSKFTKTRWVLFFSRTFTICRRYIRKRNNFPHSWNC